MFSCIDEKNFRSGSIVPLGCRSTERRCWNAWPQASGADQCRHAGNQRPDPKSIRVDLKSVYLGSFRPNEESFIVNEKKFRNSMLLNDDRDICFLR